MTDEEDNYRVGHDEQEDGNVDAADLELEALQSRMKEMEEEAAKLREMQEKVEKDGAGGTSSAGAEDDKEAADTRSIYVGNVDYSATPEEVQAHFQSCGTINRVTILCDKWTGQPKGYAYVEFADPAVVANALVLDESLFKGRLIKVTAKRTNVPGMARGRGRGRGGFRGGGGYRGGFRGRFPYRSRRGWFSPY